MAELHGALSDSADLGGVGPIVWPIGPVQDGTPV